MNKLDIKSMTLDELTRVFISFGEPSFRAKQVFDWIQVKKIKSFSQMTNINKDLHAKIEDNFYLQSFFVERKLQSSIDETTKYLFKLLDGEYVETVLMKHHHGNSICLSTQVGCKMGCSFCASTKAGFIRHLEPSEILQQMHEVENESKKKISSIVLMGIGEPLDNYDNVIKFLSLLSDKNGMNFSLRHLCLSTCGVVNRIYDLAELKLGLNLSISLHAPNDELRSQTMPINDRFNIDELISACKYYFSKTKRRITFEYALIKGVNDSKQHAQELKILLNGMIAQVNLIPVNKIEERDYQKTDKKHIKYFCDYLNNNGINTTIRRTLGTDINAACGQLRREATR